MSTAETQYNLEVRLEASAGVFVLSLMVVVVARHYREIQVPFPTIGLRRRGASFATSILHREGNVRQLLCRSRLRFPCTNTFEQAGPLGKIKAFRMLAGLTGKGGL